MIFSSDNYSPVPQQVLDALAEANKGYQPSYGEDSQMTKVRHLIQKVFEAPEAAVYLVATGTAANSLALSTLCEPWQTIFCSPVSHIHEDECNAPEFFSGAKLTLVGNSDKINPKELKKSIKAEESRGVHGPQRKKKLTVLTQFPTSSELCDPGALRRHCGATAGSALAIRLQDPFYIEDLAKLLKVATRTHRGFLVPHQPPHTHP